MSLLPWSRAATDPPVPDTTTEPAPLDDEALMSPATAAKLRSNAAQARERAERARTEAEKLLATAREQARVLLGDAEAQARELTAEAKTAATDAGACEQRALTIDHAADLRRRAVDAEQHATTLANEYATITERVATLTGRLADLGQRREDTTIALGAARDAGDVDEVNRLWGAMRALDEVIAALTEQHDAARERATTIGEPGWGGAYDQAASAAAARRRELSDVLDRLDPTRPDRRASATVREYRRALVAAGQPEDQALSTAALLVAMTQHPEAVTALLATDEPVPQSSAQTIRAADGTVITRHIRP